MIRWLEHHNQACQPNIIATKAWLQSEDGQSVAKRVVSTQDNGFHGKRLFWVGGKQISGDEGARWQAIVLPYHWNGGDPVTPAESWVYHYDGNRRHHEVVAMDAVDFAYAYGPLAIALIQSTPDDAPGPDTSAVVVLRPRWGGQGQFYVDELFFYPLGWVGTDVRAEQTFGPSGEVIRIWVTGQSGPSWSSAVRVLQLDISDGDPQDFQYSYAVPNHAVAVNRGVLGPGPYPDSDLFIAGMASPADGPSKMLVLRFGPVDDAWDFRWHHLLASDGDAVARDIGARRGPQVVPGPPPDDFIFVCGSTQREIAPSVFADDFAVACLREDPQGTIHNHWEAMLGSDGNDHALRLLVSGGASSPGNAVAVVVGVIENSSGEWDWRLAKYDDRRPQGYPGEEKEPAWDIGFPLNYPSMGNDLPAAITGTPSSGGWSLNYIWGTGSLYHNQTGRGMATVNWVQP